MVPVITAVIVFWVAGLEWKYYAPRGCCWACCLCAIAVCRRGYRLGRVIAYVDPDYSKIEMIDTHHWVRNYVQQLH